MPDTRTTVKTGRNLLGVAACSDLVEFVRERAPGERNLVGRIRALWDSFDHAAPGDAALALWGLLGRLGREVRVLDRTRRVPDRSTPT
jgi:hypothetical protein